MENSEDKFCTCPLCDGKRTVAFSWKVAQRGEKEEFYKYTKSLKFTEKLKYGDLYECLSCGTLWYLNEERTMMYRVDKEKEELLKRWNQENLMLKEEFYELFINIGASPLWGYGNSRNEVMFPCAAVTKDGVSHELCYVLFTKDPPFDPLMEKVYLISDIELLRNSVYVLPKEVRAATAKAVEISMNFAPTVIENENKEKFVLNGLNDFSKNPEIYKSKLKVIKKLKAKDFVIDSFDNREIVWIYCDWAVGIEKLLLK